MNSKLENVNLKSAIDELFKVSNKLTDIQSLTIDKAIEFINSSEENGDNSEDGFKQLAKRFFDNKSRERSDFNIFKMFTDKWRHENFHSFILKNILESYPDMCNMFLDFIGVDKNNYLYPYISCEKYRIDILIECDNHCVIIENKLNWASDQYQQLYRYYSSMKEKGFIIDRIVYLTPHKSKLPNEQSFGSDEKVKSEIVNLLKEPIYGYNGGEGRNGKDLVSCFQWYVSSGLWTQIEEDAKKVFLEQYIELLKDTGEYEMDYMVEKFIEEIRDKSDNERIQLEYIYQILCNIKKNRLTDIINQFSFFKDEGAGEWSDGIWWKSNSHSAYLAGISVRYQKDNHPLSSLGVWINIPIEVYSASKIKELVDVDEKYHEFKDKYVKGVIKYFSLTETEELYKEIKRVKAKIDSMYC